MFLEIKLLFQILL